MDNGIRRLYRGDCLDILQDYIEPESVDLIYLDPPFNSKSIYNLPFKGEDRIHTAVAAFVDTWTWTSENDVRLAEYRRGGEPFQSLATIVDFAQEVEALYGKGQRRESSLAAYLLNMSDRLLAMKPALRETGSIYLHCDPTAGHYLKLVMDSIFDKENFRNEIVWGYPPNGRAPKYGFHKKHDLLFYYSKGDKPNFTHQYTEMTAESASKYTKIDEYGRRYKTFRGRRAYMDEMPGRPVPSVWNDISPVGNSHNSTEFLGYPTQKPLALLERVIKASSNRGDVILDPFCGCGTAVHAAEDLGRQWIGVDISRFSVELIHERVVSNFVHKLRNKQAITVIGLPETVQEARELSQQDPFEFEKWACARIGSNGLGKRPGARGADGGIDGIIELDTVVDQKVFKETAIVQVKGGHVTPDSVRALSEVVRRTGSVAGIMLCFSDQLSTVENQRSRDVWSDASGTYPVIQGFSIEELLGGNRPLLPPQYGRRRGARISA